MSIIKERILNTGTDMNLKINLGSHDNFFGYQQEIDGLTQVTTNNLINPPTDMEVVRFAMTADVISTKFSFSFYQAISSPQRKANYTYAGFTSGADPSGKAKQNSFYIMDFYDSYDVYTQRKIFSTYLTKLGTTPSSLYTVDSKSDQLFYWSIPRYYLNEQTGTTCIAYVRFTFINALLGETTLFYNNLASISFKSAEKMHFKVESDLRKKTWTVLNTTLSTIYAYELAGSTAYINRINDTYPKTKDIQQKYPSGNTFNYVTGDYLIT